MPTSRRYVTRNVDLNEIYLWLPLPLVACRKTKRCDVRKYHERRKKIQRDEGFPQSNSARSGLLAFLRVKDGLCGLITHTHETALQINFLRERQRY